MELYNGLGWKKKYHAPTDFCFALKVNPTYWLLTTNNIIQEMLKIHGSMRKKHCHILPKKNVRSFCSAKASQHFWAKKTSVRIANTLRCLNIGTPKTINFPFVPNATSIILGVPIFEHIIIRLLCAQILEHLIIINFTFGTNGKFIAFRCPST